MKRPILCLHCAALLSLTSCKDKLEIGHSPTARFFTKLEAGTAAKFVAIPDDHFRAYLKQVIPSAFKGDSLNVDHEAVKGLTKIELRKKQIRDLTGIEYFTALTRLHCDNNKIESLDVSQNKALTFLSCSSNSLTSLDVSQNKALINLDCSNNKLKILDLTKNKDLKTLNCNKNKLTDLDVIQKKALTTLLCVQNQLTSLDVTQNKALRVFYCSRNKLPDLDVTQNKVLGGLDCSENQLTSLDVSQNKVLTSLVCYRNHLENLDLRQNGNLKFLSYCYNPKLKPENIKRGDLPGLPKGQCQGRIARN